MKTLIAVLSTTFVLISVAAEPGGPLRLKRSVQNGDTVDTTQRQKQFNRDRRHLILEFDQAPSPEHLNALASRGIEVLAPVPDRGVMVAVSMGVDPSMNGLRKGSGVGAVEQGEPAARNASPRLPLADAGGRISLGHDTRGGPKHRLPGGVSYPGASRP